MRYYELRYKIKRLDHWGNDYSRVFTDYKRCLYVASEVIKVYEKDLQNIIIEINVINRL